MNWSYFPAKARDWKSRILEHSRRNNSSHTNFISLFSVFGTRYIIKTGPHTSNYKMLRSMRSWNSSREVFKYDLISLFIFGLNIHPNSKQNVLWFLLNNNLSFLILISVSFVSRLISKLFKFFLSIAPIFLNISQNLSRNIIIFAINNVSNLSNIIFTPLNLLIVILWLCLNQYLIKSMNYIFSNLTILNCLVNRFIFLLFP